VLVILEDFERKHMTIDRRSTRKSRLSRREVLKALASVGGAAAASLLVPVKWVKPVVDVGILPAHAQSSVCSPPYLFSQCSDNVAFWTTDASHALELDSMVYIRPSCEGVPLVLTFIIKNSEGSIIYSFHPKVFLTSSRGYAEAQVLIPPSQIVGTPYLVSINWEFANARYGQGNCQYNFGFWPNQTK
jgi:hypothetical protein